MLHPILAMFGGVGMMRLLGIALLLGVGQVSLASFKQLGREFLQANTQVKKNTFSHGVTSLNSDVLWGNKDFTLSANFSYIKDELDDSNQASAYDQDFKNYELTLAKPFRWGGELSFKSQLAQDKFLTTPSAAFIRPNELTEFSQTLAYTQDLGIDFFGRSFKSDLLQADLSTQLSQFNLDDSTQTLLLQFLANYISARTNKTLIALQEEALQRAKRRERNIKKRVNDGLREKVDLYAASVQRLTQQEEVATAKRNFEESLNTLSSALNRQVNSDEIKAYQFDGFSFRDQIEGDVAHNIESKALDTQVELSREKLRQSQMNFTPDISLSLSLKKNDYDGNVSETLKQGNIMGDKEEKQVAFSVSLPLGFLSQKAERSQNKIELLSAQMESSNHKKNLITDQNSLRAQLSQVESNIKFSIKKRSLSKKALKGQNRLYNLGRADLDSVIGAEEDLISAERRFAGFIGTYETLRGNQAQLFGQLEQYLELSDL